MAEPRKPQPRRPKHPRGKGSRPGGPAPARAGAQHGLGLRRLEGDDFELVHPRCVEERELDYEEGIELRKEGDPEAARDALRYALQGCGDHLWIHVALGLIALEDFKDPTLARGHFGYAVQLGERALGHNFAGRLPPDRPANRPLYDAAEGLAACFDALGKPKDAQRVRDQAARWAEGRRRQPGGGPSGGSK